MSESCSGNCSSCSSGCGQQKLTEKMAKIGRKILVLSGKGGVGKSSVAAAIALKLAKSGRKVGLLDADFHGPSQPTIFGVADMRLGCSDDDGIEPLNVAGVRLVSIGLLIDNPDQAVVWRGPAKMGVLKQLLEDSDWGELDDLVMDFPPGTGDEILSACQLIPGDKVAVVVTTPQEVSLADCRKCLDFCDKVQVKVAGIVENMSYFVCNECNTRHALFAADGGKNMAAAYDLPLLAQLPLDPEFMQSCDYGNLPVEIGKFTAYDELIANLK